MARPLRVISINFPMSSASVVNEQSLKTDYALFDFDVVVIRPYSFRRTKEGTYSGADLTAAESEIKLKKPDLVRLLDQGGLMVVILDKVEKLVFNSGQFSYTGGRIESVTNYDFLDDSIYKTIRSGSGSNVSVTLQSEPFAKVVRSSEVKWTAYFQSSPNYPFTPDRVFATNGSNAFIGAVLDVSVGHLVFLPNFKKLDEPTFLEVCREYRFGREGTPPPSWAPSVSVPGLAEAETAVNNAEQAVEAAIKVRDARLATANELAAHRKLLYEKGKYQLEPAVRRALDLLGFATTGSEDIGKGFEIDGRTTVGSVLGILEVKGSKNVIKFDEYSPLVVKIIQDFEMKQKQSKGVLVGNGLCEQSPETRLGDKVFAPHVVEAAITNSVALINSAELYWLLCEVMGEKITNLEAVRETILKTRGYVDLPSFCKAPPPWKSSPE
jgi:hypothetical protein